MHEIKTLLARIRELEDLQELAERKSDILTNLLKEANAEFEQALEKITISEENFRAVFENAPEAIYIISIQTRQILYCNPFTIKWLQYSREELLSMRVDQIIEPGVMNIAENIQKAVDYGLINEMRDWRPGRNGRDDGLDAVSGCILNEPVRIRRPRSTRRSSWRSHAVNRALEIDFVLISDIGAEQAGLRHIRE